MAERLEHRRANNRIAREQEAYADNAQRRNADSKHIFRSVENRQQLVRQKHEYKKPDEHNPDRIQNAEFDGLSDALGLFRAVVVCDNRHHPVVKPEHRHKHEALQFKIHAEHRGCRGGKGDEDFVHAEGHHAADGRHDNGRHAD